MKRVLGLIILGLWLVGCNQFGQPSAEEIVRRAQAAMEKVEQAHAVVEVEATIDGETMRLVGEGWMQGEQARTLVLESSKPELIGTLAVSDGATGWLYHPDSKQALTGNLDALDAYREAEADMPAAIDFKSMTEMVDEMLRITDEELVGSESIAGLDSWHLRLTPNKEAPPQLNAAGGVVELWISKEHDLPLQLTYTGGTMGNGRVTVREYEDAPKLAADLFTFAPPSGATVTDVATLLPERMTLSEAREQATFALLATPADSAEATLVEVFRLKDSYVQKFDGTLGEWMLSQSATMPDKAHADEKEGAARAESVTLRDTEATLVSDPEAGWTMVAWQEKGIFVTLRGQFSPETAIKLAEGLE